MTDHPITPPPELVQQWLGNYFGCVVNGELSDSEKYLATQAARWGADQELEACCAEMGEWQSLNNCYGSELAEDLRTARRPKPPSLKEQALDGLRNIEANIPQSLRAFESSCDTIRRALEALPD